MSQKRLGALISSGKDSLYALYLMKQKGHEIACAMTMRSRNKASYMFHTPNIGLVELQAESMALPLVTWETEGKKEEELADLKALLVNAKEKYAIEGITTGALYSQYQKERIEKLCEEIGLECYSPLWHMDQADEMRSLLRDGFVIVFSSVAAYGLDKTWLGRVITEKDIDKLVELDKKCKLNIAGEGGEFESLVIDCPLFSKSIEIVEKEIVEEDENTAQMVVKKAELKKDP